MLQFSANLGFLWEELALTEAIAAAAKYGFDAVECHWPFEVPSVEIKYALSQANLKMIGLNTRLGNIEAGDFGVAACFGREDDLVSNGRPISDCGRADQCGSSRKRGHRCGGIEGSI